MFNVLKPVTLSIAVFCASFSIAGAPAKRTAEKPKAEITGQGPAVLWQNPGNIAARNLYYGPGGKAHEPHGPFTFKEEDTGGSNPKFDVVDEDGVKWKVKLGDEARPETVASRIVWAVGYFVNEDYFVPEMRVKEMPRLHRGHKLIRPDGMVTNARLKRSLKSEKKIGQWEWMDSPFQGTREYNGLRVLMAVINNWDLKDENNAILQENGDDGPRQRYIVSDLGASFGTTGLSWTRGGSRGNLKAYTHSKWIKNIDPEFVDFNVPSRPALDHAPAIHQFKMRLHLRELGRHIPRTDARWMGDLLGRLSGVQIRDAFRSAGYGDGAVEAFSRVLESRIAALKTM